MYLESLNELNLNHELASVPRLHILCESLLAGVATAPSLSRLQPGSAKFSRVQLSDVSSGSIAGLGTYLALIQSFV